MSIVTKIKKKKEMIIADMIQKLYQSFILIMTLRVEITNAVKKKKKIVRVITNKNEWQKMIKIIIFDRMTNIWDKLLPRVYFAERLSLKTKADIFFK